MANALLPNPGIHALVKIEQGYEMPVLIYRDADASASNPRPTLIFGGGFDSNMEELVHVFCFAALGRGYNAIVYEGPGQPTLINKQHIGFIPDWESAVSPMIDHVIERSSSDLAFIDTSKIGLLGYSLGGYLAARAAAFESRLAAVICIDGVWSFADAFYKVFSVKEQWERGDIAGVRASFEGVTTESSTNERWFHDHLKFSFCTDSIEELFGRLSKMTLDGIADKIKMPAFIGAAEEDIFFLGQPEQVAEAIGSNTTLFKSGSDQAARAHCQSGALGYLNQAVLEWFAEIIGEKKL